MRANHARKSCLSILFHSFYRDKFKRALATREKRVAQSYTGCASAKHFYVILYTLRRVTNTPVDTTSSRQSHALSCNVGVVHAIFEPPHGGLRLLPETTSLRARSTTRIATLRVGRAQLGQPCHLETIEGRRDRVGYIYSQKRFEKTCFSLLLCNPICQILCQTLFVPRTTSDTFSAPPSIKRSYKTKWR